MKRIWIIGLFFCSLLALLCIVGCGGPEQCYCGLDSIEVEGYERPFGSCTDPTATGKYELTGCRVATSCIDCYWFPMACGYYQNDLLAPSYVICGWDFSMCEIYGDSAFQAGNIPLTSNIENRKSYLATEGKDYRIDSMKITFTNLASKELEDDFDITSSADWKALADGLEHIVHDIKMELTVKYTAFTELNRIQLNGDVVYNGGEWGSSHNQDFFARVGNWEGAFLKESNIQPGEHVVNAVISLNFSELVRIQQIGTVTLVAWAYEGE